MEEDLLVLRKKLIESPDRAEIVWQAVENYNKRINQLAQELSPDESKSGAVQKKGAEIIGRLAQRDDLEDRANLHLIQSILIESQQGVPIEKTLQGIKVTRIVHNYSEKIEELRRKGVAVEFRSYSEAARIPHLFDYQIPLFPRQFEIPRPFSQNLIKKTVINEEQAYWMALDYLVDAEAKMQLKENMGRESLDQIKKRLQRSKEFQDAAKNMVSDLPQFKPIRLISKGTLDKVVDNIQKRNPRNRRIKNFLEGKTNYFSREVFSELNIIPDLCYDAAYSGLNPDQPYLTVISQGFDKHKKIFLMQNNLAGLKMLLYAEKLGNIDPEKADPKILEDIARITKQEMSEQYAWSVEGLVFSSSGVRSTYDVEVTHIAVFPKNSFKKAFEFWPDLTTSCVCKDAKYIRKMHKKWTYVPSYVDKHNAYFVLSCILNGVERGDFYLNPLALPKKGKLEFEEKLRRALVIKKSDGQPKVLNRAEREVISNAHTVMAGFNNCYSTVNVDRTVEGARKFYLFR